MAQTDRERMLELIRTINQHRHEFYDLLEPTVSNETFDALMDELSALQRKLELYMANSPATYPCCKTVKQLATVRHTAPIPAAEPTDQITDLVKFQMQKQLLLLPKLKSVPVKAVYCDHELKELCTCGNGIEGLDILHNLGCIAELPFAFRRRERLVITGEIFINTNAFEELKQGFVFRKRSPYTDINDLIYDAVHFLDAKICRKYKLQFTATDVLEGMEQYTTKAQRLGQLMQYGFTVLHFLVTNRPLNAQQMEIGIRQLQAECLENGLPIEGVTVQYNDAAFSAQCGTSGYPDSDRVLWMCDDPITDSQKAA